MISRRFESTERLPPLPEGAFSVKTQIVGQLAPFDDTCRLFRVCPESGQPVPLAVEGRTAYSPFPLTLSGEERRWLGVERLVCPGAVSVRLLSPEAGSISPLSPEVGSVNPFSPEAGNVNPFSPEVGNIKPLSPEQPGEISEPAPDFLLRPGDIRETADILTACGFLPEDPEAQDRFYWRRSCLRRKALGETYTLNGSTALLLQTDAGLLLEDAATRPELRRQGRGQALVRAILRTVGKPVWVLYEAENAGFWERF